MIRVGDLAQEEEHLFGKCKAPNSVPSTEKNNKQKNSNDHTCHHIGEKFKSTKLSRAKGRKKADLPIVMKY
jgi:hypothetical protein